ncbi:ABC transporter ATP-binding protein [Paenibacillus pasadenensis]|uniref:ABC transporter ATP-binding protein n=1 Tax=Paenibacillus pasadenensis TaxID=217090 RepID=UPI00048E88A7
MGALAQNAAQQEIVVDRVGMDYGGGSEPAIREISLGIRKGEFVSLLGPSGCGKTTLLRMMADLLEPTSGGVGIAGGTPRQARLTRKFGIVFQTPALYEWRTVRGNVELPLELAGMPRARRRERAEELLELVGLGAFAGKRPRQLSGGMQQRVSIARALAADPQILLMDEPFSALDEFTRERLGEELLGLWSRTGCTVVFVTHSIAEAAFLSDRVFVLSARPGRLSAEVEVGLPRPRVGSLRAEPEFHRLTSSIRQLFGEAEP